MCIRDRVRISEQGYVYACIPANLEEGKTCPSLGFIAHMDTCLLYTSLMAALSRQQIDVPVTLVNTVILYETSARSRALRLGSYFRDKGLAVQSMKKKEQVALEDYKAMAIQRLSLIHI